ncbi:MAG: hypothetical protein ABR503_15540 [Chitinophagaceae bacterium]
MKKLALILLIITYSMSTFGVSVKEFYCCGKLKSISVSLVDTGKAKCNKGGLEDGCCKLKFKTLKVKDNHFASVHPALPLKHSAELLSYNLSYKPLLLPAQEVDVINGSHAPPVHKDVPIYISNCVFRI